MRMTHFGDDDDQTWRREKVNLIAGELKQQKKSLKHAFTPCLEVNEMHGLEGEKAAAKHETAKKKISSR